MKFSLVAGAPAIAACEAEGADTNHVQDELRRATDRPTPVGARKGVGLGVGTKHTVEQLDALDVNWFYTWDAAYPSVRAAQEFVPMIWGPKAVREHAVDDVLSELNLSKAKELLGFNEPDHPNQAAMSVTSAIKYWPRLEASGLRLGSPAPAATLGDWFTEFMHRAAAKDLRVDFITMHSYPSPNSEAFLETVQTLYDRYQKPIWITEYAIADWNATAKSPSRYSEKQIMAFMAETAAGLRRMPFVERFAWMTKEEGNPVMGASALFRKDGSLTPTGDLYRSL